MIRRYRGLAISVELLGSLSLAGQHRPVLSLSLAHTLSLFLPLSLSLSLSLSH